MLRCPSLVLSVSDTTRAPRPGEVDGVSYHFVTQARFRQLIDQGGLLEWAQYTGTYYGTPRQPVLDALASGQTVLLEIDLDGARQVRSNHPAAVLVFIAPPSLAELERRLRERGTDSEQQIEARLAKATVEMAAEDEFDHVIINDDLTAAVDDLVNFLGLGSCGRQSYDHNN